MVLALLPCGAHGNIGPHETVGLRGLHLAATRVAFVAWRCNRTLPVLDSLFDGFLTFGFPSFRFRPQTQSSAIRPKPIRPPSRSGILDFAVAPRPPAIPWMPTEVVAGLSEIWRGLFYFTVGAVDLQFGVRDEVGVASGRLPRHLAPPTPSSEERRIPPLVLLLSLASFLLNWASLFDRAAAKHKATFDR
jgi:hypothetical protein